MSKFIDFCEKIYVELVRDIRKWPEHKFKGCYMNPESINRVLADRAAWLKTKAGKRMLKLNAEMDRIVAGDK